ncbi:MAG: DUF3592 domain-containing protein [Planctomycetaceae bacterium]|nr:DUF3592 domain-containing protein [Planctomycetaceae bacterium]
MTGQKKISIPGIIILSFAGLMFVAAGIALLTKAFRGVQEARESAGWPTAPGKITRSEMSVSQQDSRSGDRQITGHRSNFYTALVEYEFDVNGEQHQGNRVAAVQEMIAKESHARAILDQYPVDKVVMVAYSPLNPDTCVLEPGSWGGAVIMLILGCCFTAIPMIFLIVIRKQIPRRQPANQWTQME